MIKPSSFNSQYKPEFKNNEWILQMPSNAVIQKSLNLYEVHLPVYVSRILAVGGNILRPLRKEYREWLLNQQRGVCAICGEGSKQGKEWEWNLDHQPPLSDPNSKFIDYERTTNNRVIHHKCDSAQNKKSKPTEE
jgi:hypothetical protein